MDVFKAVFGTWNDLEYESEKTLVAHFYIFVPSANLQWIVLIMTKTQEYQQFSAIPEQQSSFANNKNNFLGVEYPTTYWRLWTKI